MSGKSRLQSFSIVVIALWIGLSPAISQWFAVESGLVRPWKMYSTVAHGAAFGHFILVDSSGREVSRISLREQMGHATYREQQLYAGSGGVLHYFDGPDSFRSIAKDLCSSSGDWGLRFEGRVALPSGWRMLKISDAELCGISRP